MDNSELLEIAQEYGTPTFVFDVDAFWRRLDKIHDIFGPDVRLCYAMKANPFLASAAADHGLKLEVCSPGELAICEDAGISAPQIVYSGVNKQVEDVSHAIAYRVGVLTAESKQQVELIEQCAAKAQTTVDVLLRLNAGSQFGMSKSDLIEVVGKRGAYAHLNMVGLHYFVGTQRKKLKHQARELAPLLHELVKSVEVTVEMGRFFATSCGTYVTCVADVKENEGTNYAILDGGINHLTYAGQIMGMKLPALVNLTALDEPDRASDPRTWTLCGSLCTVNDVLVRACELDTLELGDVLAFANAGAYSVTEGVHLFLSRTMPRVVLRYDGGSELARDFIETSALNTVQR